MKHEKQPKPMKPNRYDPIAAALQEDIGVGDITTEFFVPEPSPVPERQPKFSAKSIRQPTHRLFAGTAPKFPPAR